MIAISISVLHTETDNIDICLPLNSVLNLEIGIPEIYMQISIITYVIRFIYFCHMISLCIIQELQTTNTTRNGNMFVRDNVKQF